MEDLAHPDKARMRPGPTAGPGDPADVRRQLDRILASEAFQVSDRHRRFLAYVVTEAIEGRADRIKAYSIATEVFGRDPDFDAQNDPIVRVEAGHLRRALERYYLDAGRSDSIVITIPKGSYVPRFDPREVPAGIGSDGPPEAEPPVGDDRRRLLPALLVAAALGVTAIAVANSALWPSAPGAARPDVPRLIVEPFADLSQSEQSGVIAEGLTQEVVGQIARFRDIIVLAPDRADVAAPSRHEAPRYKLLGGVALDDDAIRLQARLESLEDGSVLWAESYRDSMSVSHLIDIQTDIADRVATALAQPYGVIFRADASRRVDRPPEDWSAYACTLSYYSYRIRLEPALHPEVRTCLQQAVARFPDYATAWGLLAQVYIDELRFRFPAQSDEAAGSIERALAAARRAVELDPVNVRALQAEMFALYFAGDTEAALRVGRRALAINPNDTELQGEVGFRLALSGDWEAGCALLARAREWNSGPPGYYDSGLALCAYQRGDLAEAVSWIDGFPATANPQFHLIAAIVYGEAGHPAAAAEVDWLLQHAPHLTSDTRTEIALRVVKQEDVERFMQSLAKAGLPKIGNGPDN